MLESEIIKPWLRAIKYSCLRYLAEYNASHRLSNKTHSQLLPVNFIVGCGRSGTTILGYVLSLHPNISYRFEPYHLWAAIDPMTDVLNLYHHINAYLLMNASHCSEESICRFQRSIASNPGSKNATQIIDKTPLNALRIGYLNALTPTAKFIHIVRNGVEVCHSIHRLATTNTYKIAGKPTLNQWWGVDDYKWKALARDGKAAGYFEGEVDGLIDNYSKGAYEWLVTLAEMDKQRQQLGDRLYEITYDRLTSNPVATLESICQFLDLDCPKTWLETAASQIAPHRPDLGKTINLPPAMSEAFNYYQTRFGFDNRSSPLPANEFAG
jgi:hypothetical protein